MNKLTTRSRLALRPDTAVLCALVLISPQLLGGAFPWSVLVIAGLALSALATALWVRRSAANPAIDGLFVVMGLAWLWTCVQAVPLPSGLAQALGLRSLESAARLQGLAWAGTIPLTISYDPGSTQLQILVGIGILSAFLAARLGGPTALKPIAVATVTSALLLCLEGLAHLAVGADSLFGVYSPRFTIPRLLTPLMNNNHLGGFALLGGLIAAGLAAQGGTGPRRAWAGASAVCATTVAWTLSRGAIGALLFGFVLFAAWLMQGERTARRRAAIPVAVLGAAVAGTLAFAGLAPILRRFEAQGFDKLTVALHGLQLLDGSGWWLGVGRGAFSTSFVAEEGSLGRYTHPENILVQWTSEWGVPVAAALFVVVTFGLWKRLRTAEEPLVAAVAIAILALSLQNLVDFSLEMPGIVVVVATLLGALLPAARTATPRRSWSSSLAVFLGFAIVLGTLGPRVLGSDTQSVIDRLLQAMDSDQEPDFESTLRRGLALHPSEPAFALLAATYSGSKGYADAARWFSVVTEEAPGWAAPHVLAARWLFERGRLDQALLEIREAEQRHPGSAEKVVCRVLARFPLIEHLERAAPAAELREPYLNRATTCAGLPSDLRAEIDAAILQTDPTWAPAVLRQVRRFVSTKRFDEAKRLLEPAVEHDPGDASLWMALIGAHLSAGEPEEARAALSLARSKGLDERSLLESQARIEAAMGETETMRATLTRLRGQARGDAALIAKSFLLEAELQASLGNVDEALAAYTEADNADPTTPALQYAAALALKSRRPTQAHRFYRTLCHREPGGAACAQEARLSTEASPGRPETPTP